MKMNVEIYEKYGTKNWLNQKLVLKKSIKENEICETVKQSFWPIVQKEYRNLLTQQNAWDDEDKNIWISQTCKKM